MGFRAYGLPDNVTAAKKDASENANAAGYGEDICRIQNMAILTCIMLCSDGDDSQRQRLSQLSGKILAIRNFQT